MKRKYKHNTLIKVWQDFPTSNSSELLFHSNSSYLWFSFPVLSLFPSSALTNQHYLKELLANVSKIFFEVIDTHCESFDVGPFLILPKHVKETLQTTTRTHVPFSDSPCVSLTEMSGSHICPVRPPGRAPATHLLPETTIIDIINCKIRPDFRDVKILHRHVYGVC